MKKTNKCIALLLTVVMLLGLVPMAFAEDGKVLARGDLNGISWTLTDNGVLTVSGNGPVVDKEEFEYDDEGEVVSSSKLDCIGWQIYAAFEEMTEGMRPAEVIDCRYNYVKELIIEEGITAIPDSEFDSLYPRTIVLPASLKSIEWSAFNASFADSLTVKNKELEINGAIHILGYQDGVKPYASLDKAKQAKINADVKSDKFSTKLNALYDMQTAYAIQKGLDAGMTKEDFLAYFNEAYGKSFTKLNQCIRNCLRRVNRLLETNYQSADEVLYVTEEFGSPEVMHIDALDEIINATYDSLLDEARLTTMDLGAAYSDTNMHAYQFLTIYAPEGSGAEEAAKITGVPFVATTKSTFFDKVRAFFEKIRAWFETTLSLLKLRLPQLDLPKVI